MKQEEKKADMEKGARKSGNEGKMCMLNSCYFRQLTIVCEKVLVYVVLVSMHV